MRIKKKYLQEKTVDEVEEKKMTKKIYSPQEVDKAEKEGIGIEVDGTVVPTEDGGLEVTTMNEVVSGEHVVQFHSERSGEEPFYMNGVKWQFVNGIYPNGKKDIAVYRFDHDLAYDYMWFMEEVVPKPVNEVGAGKVHTKKFDRCVKDVKKNSPDVNPYAVCQASLGAKAIKKSHQRKEDYTNESNFTMTKGQLLESLNIKKSRKVIKTIKVKDIKND